eukprot:XP_015584587.1 uncharacterized protein LOC8264548 isoform X1 [Ricinus communis]
MAEDPEKKFQSIMEKLFSSPSKPLTNPSRGKKRPNQESALALVERGDVAVIAPSRQSLSAAEAPLCRPWDRGDLMRRAATFKSMTWFAKPRVVNAVNCARRGWINLEMDIIGCEACGARLLFSTPSSWSQQQVEKAAMVFSLKLDSGHKLHCPWIDNVCDERLAEFPPTPPPVLVDKFKERSSALLQLLALPVISSAAMEYMRSAQLEEFLRQPPTLDYENGSTYLTQIEPLENECGADSASLYYQAQKLISLCGWEPQSLPYIVDCKDGQKQLIKDAKISNSSNIMTGGRSTSISFYSATVHESMEATGDCHALNALQADPQSVVLDCKLCGAVVGLWTYSTVPRPVELFRLVGYTEVNSKKNYGQDSCNGNKVDNREVVVNSASNGSLSSTEKPSNLKLTIAGGPPPTKQNFKATISFPVIGRNLRARLSYDSDFRDRTSNDRERQSGSHDKNLSLEEKVVAEESLAGQASQPEAKTPDQGQCSYASGDQSSCLELENVEKGSALRKESDLYMLLEGMDFVIEGNFSEKYLQDSSTEGPTESTPDKAQGFGLSANVTTGDGNNTSESCDQEQVPGANTKSGEDIAHKIHSRKGITHSNTQDTSNTQAKSQEGIKQRGQNPLNNEIIAYGMGKELKQLSDKAMEFDPIRQHRHFCPWIVSSNSGAAGWQQTLFALFRQKEHSSPSTNSPASTPKIKVGEVYVLLLEALRY